MQCKFLVGADGGNSRVRKQIDPNYNLTNMMINKQDLFSGEIDIDSSNYYFIKNLEFSDMFSWFNIENRNIFIGTICKNIEDGNEYLNKLIEHLQKVFNLKINKRIRSEVCMSDFRISEDRFLFGNEDVLLIGEASGLIYTFGEGLPSAFISGEISAESIKTGLKENKNPVDIYENNIKEEKQYALSGANIR